MAENLSRRWRLAAVVPPAASRKFLQHELASFTFVKKKKKTALERLPSSASFLKPELRTTWNKLWKRGRGGEKDWGRSYRKTNRKRNGAGVGAYGDNCVWGPALLASVCEDPHFDLSFSTGGVHLFMIFYSSSFHSLYQRCFLPPSVASSLPLALLCSRLLLCAWRAYVRTRTIFLCRRVSHGFLSFSWFIFVLLFQGRHGCAVLDGAASPLAFLFFLIVRFLLNSPPSRGGPLLSGLFSHRSFVCSFPCALFHRRTE